jgi:hypothetical protein
MSHNRSHIIVNANITSPALNPSISRIVITPPMDKDFDHVTEQADHEASTRHNLSVNLYHAQVIAHE